MALTWWRIKDSQGYQLHPSPDQEKLEEEMAFKSMQDKDGGYCPMCDTVWASPGKCRCKINKGQYGKFNTEPKEYHKDFIDQYMNKVEMSKEDKQLYDMTWNAAIEAAAKQFNDDCEYVSVATEIRKLKK